MNEAMAEFIGMSVMGMKTHSFLYKILDKLNIKLTYNHPRDPVTGKMLKNNEVEHDQVSTWLEEEELVVNFVQCKTMEVKPWTPLFKTRSDRLQ